MSIKKGTPPPRYDKTFKSGAVKMVTEQSRSVKEVASDLGICVDTLCSRIKQSDSVPSVCLDNIYVSIYNNFTTKHID